MKDLIFIIIMLLLGLICFFVIINSSIGENQKYIYECTDYKGDLIYCRQAYVSKGGMFGITEDGTKITITSYKSILKEDMKLKEN